MIWGAPNWVVPALAIALVAASLLWWSYRPASTSMRRRTLAVCLKLVAILLLALCLAEPLLRRTHAKPGVNKLWVLADDSRSMQVRDTLGSDSRADRMLEAVVLDSAWMRTAKENFEIELFAFGERLRNLRGPEDLAFEDTRTALEESLQYLYQQAAVQPIAAVFLFGDACLTDSLDELELVDTLPPIHPVLFADTPQRDLGIARLQVSQTDFEQSPVSIHADVRTIGCAGDAIIVELLDETEAVVASESTIRLTDDEPIRVSLDAPADSAGLHFYRVRARLLDESAAAEEATLANNERWAAVDRSTGPFRVLYVSGRPNWEFKFMRRALDGDSELELVGLVRIARRQPRFTFREGSDRRNQLWDGFDQRDAEYAEQVDEPVLTRLGTRDELELRGGFPRRAEDLFVYDGLIVDDMEAAFFDGDQQALIEDFVSRRGGGFLALGGENTFVEGGYHRTPLGDLLPVYLNHQDGARPSPLGYQLALTREGWLEPWVRLRGTEQEEFLRLAEMPRFQTLNRVGDLKPGAICLLEAHSKRGDSRSAFAVQRFGRGRAAAMMIGDLWRWDLQRPNPELSELGRAWRQTLRWLVSDVPRQVTLELTSLPGEAMQVFRASLRDAAFHAIDDAALRIEVHPPQGDPFELDAVPSTTEAGTWLAELTPRTSGPYRACLSASDADGAELGTDEAGFVWEPEAQEYRDLIPDRAAMQRLADRTGGSIVEVDDLESLAEELPGREMPVTEEELDPIWHRWWIMALALACLCGEWGLRRKNGLA
ncbi:MAG: putative membrane protein [Planctomycetota bacterium]